MAAPQQETCDVCGSTRLVWRKCKQVCLDCQHINRSCADLAVDGFDGGTTATGRVPRDD